MTVTPKLRRGEGEGRLGDTGDIREYPYVAPKK